MHLGQLAFIDYVFILITLVSTFLALRKGLVREVISLVALLGGLLLAAHYYPSVARWFVDLARTDAVASLIGFLAIFLFTLLVGAVVAFLVNRFIKMAALAWIDRLLGGIFGLLRGWAISSVIALALVAFPVRPDTIARSVCAPFLLAGAHAAVLMAPQSLKVKFNEQYQKMLQTWNHDRSLL